MNINDLLIKDVMIMDLQATDKKGAIDEMVQNYTMVAASLTLTLTKKEF